MIRSIGVANFNVHHLEELKKARPDHIPAGESSNRIGVYSIIIISHVERNVFFNIIPYLN